MIEIFNPKELKVGDVLLITRGLHDRHTDKPFTWRYFAVVERVGRKGCRAIRVGDEAEEPRTIPLYETECVVKLLVDDEWPDGIWSTRTRWVLEGRIDLNF